MSIIYSTNYLSTCGACVFRYVDMYVDLLVMYTQTDMFYIETVHTLQWENLDLLHMIFIHVARR